MCAGTIASSRVQLAASLALAVALCSVASAAPPEPAEALIEQGVKLRVEGKHAEALELFSKAHAQSPSARTLAQMGLAEGSLRRWLDAEAHLAAALEAGDTPWIEVRRNREALEQALVSVRRHIGSLVVLGPAGTEVSVNGRVAGHLPLVAPLRLAEGQARVDGFTPEGAHALAGVAVVGGAESTVVLDLPPVLQRTPISADDLPTERAVTSQSRWKTWTGATLLAVSAAALATGIVWLSIDGNPDCSPPAGATCYWVRDTKTQGWIAVGAGAALGAAGGFFLWKGRTGEAHLVAGPGTVGATGTF